MRSGLSTLVFVGLASTANATDAVVEAATARPAGAGWTFDVTLSHADTGWDDYADGWRVVLADGTVLGTRDLLHPHVAKQPFTRSLSGVKVPVDVSTVFIEARTNTDGWGAARFEVVLP